MASDSARTSSHGSTGTPRNRKDVIPFGAKRTQPLPRPPTIAPWAGFRPKSLIHCEKSFSIRYREGLFVQARIVTHAVKLWAMIGQCDASPTL